VIPFQNILLIDTNCINPQRPRGEFCPETTQSLPEVASDGERLTIEQNLVLGAI
jgi:hypothetical protein